MKLVITEKQLKLILSNQVINDLDEQEAPVNPEPSAGTSDTQTGGQGYPSVGKWESGATRGPGNQIGITKWSDVVGSTLQRGKGNPLKEQALTGIITPGQMAGYESVAKDMNSHTFLTVAGIASYFIPYVGPIIAAGFGVADAKLYHDEGDDRSAAISLFFAMLPGVQSLRKLMGLEKLGSKGLIELGKKIIVGSKITAPAEKEVLSNIVKYRKLIQTEITKKAKEITIKQGRKTVQKQIIKKGIKKGAGKFAVSGGLGYVSGEHGVGGVYDALYKPKDIFTRTKNEPPATPSDFEDDDYEINAPSNTSALGGSKPN